MHKKRRTTLPPPLLLLPRSSPSSPPPKKKKKKKEKTHHAKDGLPNAIAFNGQWVFLIFMSVFEIGSLVCGLAVSSNMLIGGRTLAGIGASGITNGGMTILAGAVPPHKRSRMSNPFALFFIFNSFLRRT
jgi:MFS family permease